MNAKDYAAEWKWMNSSEAKQRSAAAKSQALSEFKNRFPRADMSKFTVQAEFDANRKATAIVLFPVGDGSWEDPLLEDSKYWSQPLKDALGMQQDGGFPYQLSLLTTQSKRAPQPVPAIAFSDSITQSIADLFGKQVKIHVTPTDYFTTKFRQIFAKTQIKFTTAKYARKWLAKPDMSFWSQQLNFALWCATTGCGVSREMLFSNSTLQLSEQIRAFYQFHVYYTTRKILHEMGGIHSKNALPDDPAFNQQENPYDVASYKRICAEFGIDPSTDFRFTYGQNHGLGYVNIMYSDGPFAQKQWQYPPADLSNPSSQRLKGDSGTTDNNTIAFIRNDQGVAKQFEHFVPNQTSGLTLTGLVRINQSIMAFGYGILGAQVNSRSSILGNLGTARNTQTDFLVLIEDSIKTLNVSNGAVKYQDAIQATKVRLNLAVARGVLLLPARMIINTESVVGYNNNLRRATDDMKLGVNNHVNQDTKKASLKLMAGGPSKVNPPNSHPANPVHKQATEAQGIAHPATQPATPATPSATPPAQPATPATTEPVDSHRVNKALIAVGALALIGSARKEKTWPAALKMKLTIEPMSPGRREPSFLPIAWSPCPTAFVPALSPFNPARARALRTMPTARATACRVQPYFLKMSFTLSSRGLCLSLTSTSVLILASLASFAVTRACAASLSDEEVFSSSMTRLSSVILVSSSSPSFFRSFRGVRASFFALSSFERSFSSLLSCTSLSTSLRILSACFASFRSCDSCCSLVCLSPSHFLLSSLSVCIASSFSGPFSSSNCRIWASASLI